jgi:long-chain fatty acid transport protein
MSYEFLKTGLVAIVAAGVSAGSAFAGGFSRGQANTDILFEEGTANVNAGFFYVSPQVTYSTIGGAKATDPRFTGDYWIPNIAVKARFADPFACALTYTQSFGGTTNYGTQAQAAQVGSKTYSKDFVSNEYGATCDLRFDAGRGRFHLLGGIFIQDFSYTAVSNLGTLTLKDSGSFGYRIGAAYEIPEYALRASVMYRSAVKQNANGTFVPTTAGAFVFGTSLPISSAGSGTMPQSVKVSLQSGVAPGWLVFGSVQWTNWSVLQTLNYNIGTSAQTDKYYFRDGWTIQAGVGHQFTDDIAGSLSLTWDQGVGSNAFISTGTWTVGAGTEIKLGPGKLQLGAGATYITAGTQTTAGGASFNATTNASWAYSFGAGYKIAF